jgi:hypothetical protein
MLCCAITNLLFKIKVHTRGQADHNEEVEDGTDALPKLDQLTLGMCADLEGSGATVNMYNYYMSATTAIHLKERKIYCRGTIRLMRKYLPKNILFSNAET